MRLAVMVRSGIDRPDAKREAVRNGIEAAVTKGIAAKQAPGGEENPADGAEAPYRLGRVRRAGGLETTAPGESR